MSRLCGQHLSLVRTALNYRYCGFKCGAFVSGSLILSSGFALLYLCIPQQCLKFPDGFYFHDLPY